MNISTIQKRKFLNNIYKLLYSYLARLEEKTTQLLF